MKSQHPDFTPTHPKTEDLINHKIAGLSLEEKIRLLGGNHDNTLGIAEKGIPELRFADGPLGVHWWCDASTAYPATIALAASWDTDLAYAVGKALGRDCRARGVHVLLAPGVNLYRSPLCGRNFEYMGEDPHLTGKIAGHYIEGVQDQRVVATIKHYACNFQEYDRHNVSTDVDERTLREMYLPAFEMAVQEHGVGAVMCAYNLVNGQHCSEHNWLINTVLKEEWGFEGVLMSDWVSTYDAVRAANGGLDLEMPYGTFMNAENLLPAVASGVVSERTIDEKVRRLLRLMHNFGWLDGKQLDETIPHNDPSSAAIALRAAQEGTVLLKNDGLLPIDKQQTKKIALLGLHASAAIVGGGGSSYTPTFEEISILDGLRERVGDAFEITHFIGVNPWQFEETFERSVFSTLDGQPGLTAEYFSNSELEGTPTVIHTEAHCKHQWFHERENLPEGVDRENFSMRWTACFTANKDGEHWIYRLASDGESRILINGEEAPFKNLDGMPRIVLKLHAGQTVNIVFEYRKRQVWNAVGLGWMHADDALIDYANALASTRDADAVIISTGFTKQTESECFDRAFGLSHLSEKIIEDVAAINPNIILTLHAGGGVDLSRLEDKVKAILHLWYPGQEGGRALADILLGKINPSAKLPITIERKLEERLAHTCYHDTDNDKHVVLHDGVFSGYRGFDRDNIEPLYPFGFGLSYTSFDYANLKLGKRGKKKKLKAGKSLQLSFDIKNVGSVAGAEIAQVYVRDVHSREPRPVKELKGFAKVHLEPAATQVIHLKLQPRAFEYFDPIEKRWVAEAGKFEIWVGASSRDIRLKAAIELIIK